MRIAICSKDLEYVDGNFNKATYFLIYDLSFEGAKFVTVREVEPIQEMLDEECINERIDSINDCKMVFCGQIPRTSKARLLNRGIFTVWMRKKIDVATFLENLVERIAQSPTPMMKKILEEEHLNHI